ncbi:glycosyltransferase family 2 protein [Lapillicoccus jejuensis]|uniref:GT2 family glycosyltransferase n=1 Tax=Lapillicoccus jejuensis TaxID=402171 RepID=A0A542DVX4_9MICO|nr:glycosyltransferase family 2 protein [Lapillicoccus jejuensis]TQJ07259.1 hypothetical protein FB458_0317 [Lapillicoccus jejuensis]
MSGPDARPDARPDVTVVVVTWRQRELLPRCLASVRAQTRPARLLVVDNGSDDGTAQVLEEQTHPDEVLRLPTNAGYAGAMAVALPRVTTRWVAVLNDDAVADPGWLAASLRVLEARDDLAAVTARMLLDAPGGAVVNNAGVVLLRDGYGADRGLGEPDGAPYDRPVEVFGFSGGAAVLRTLAAGAVGGFRDWFMYYEDTDLSWRLRLAGWRIGYAPDAVVRHRHAASSDPASRMFAVHTERNRLLMVAAEAPAGFAARVLVRFVVTTASLAVRRLRPATASTAAVHDPRLRLAVLAGLARRLPAVLADRRDAPRTRSRRAVLREWRGVPAREWGQES